MYRYASVNAPATCESQTQTRTCSDGTWGAYNFNRRRVVAYTHTSCSQIPQCSSPTTSHGGTQSVTMYRYASVNAPAKCESQTQSRTCNSGTWGAYNRRRGVAYTHTSCRVEAMFELKTSG